jgi:hypothetical protein
MHAPLRASHTGASSYGALAAVRGAQAGYLYEMRTSNFSSSVR